MGLLHFIIYINDMLFLKFFGKILLYADDAVLYYAYDTLQELESADAALLNKWLCRSVLKMNIGKTCYMTFGRARNLRDLNITIDNEKINRVLTAINILV